jgi:hypothetical protein
MEQVIEVKPEKIEDNLIASSGSVSKTELGYYFKGDTLNKLEPFQSRAI